MSNFASPGHSSPIVSNEHYEFLQMSQVGRLSDRAAKVVDAEEQSLRQFNAELLQKIGDYRKKNLDLAASENELRTELARQTKRMTDQERELTMKFEAEIRSLTSQLSEQDRVIKESNEDWSRRLSKLSDENWAQGLENENLRRGEEDLQSQIEKFQAELDRTREFENQNIQLIKSTDVIRNRELHTAAAYEALRVEYAKIDRCYTESNAALVQLQGEMRERMCQHQAELQTMTLALNEKAAQDSASIRNENQSLREQLGARETRLDQEKASLQTWKEQLSYLDQYLKQFSEKLKRSKSEIIRLSKGVEDEVKFSLSNPFTDYFEMANLEIAQISLQLSGLSSMSPLKAKLETRLQQALDHRDGIQDILGKSSLQLSEHVKVVQSLVKSLEFSV